MGYHSTNSLAKTITFTLQPFVEFSKTIIFIENKKHLRSFSTQGNPSVVLSSFDSEKHKNSRITSNLTYDVNFIF